MRRNRERGTNAILTQIGMPNIRSCGKIPHLRLDQVPDLTHSGLLMSQKCDAIESRVIFLGDRDGFRRLLSIDPILPFRLAVECRFQFT
jgi:hypothetical protein